MVMLIAGAYVHNNKVTFANLSVLASPMRIG
jgi:hypothetical protein